ncbi:MAG: hypothetical protein MUC35_07600 [Candidatus Margulisbacteria bacterium]|jgi:hypothetical protein|nr:hypothetical protein [Candidatus Margulisiibacteriota bacterium]
MRLKRESIVLIIFLLGLAGACSAAVPKFMPFYTIAGSVGDAADTSGVKAPGHEVVFFKEMDMLRSIVSVYTIATIEADGKFRLNASANHGLLPLKVGEKCKVAVVKDPAGYGAGPVEVVISGTGYQTVGGLVMALGAGVGLPGSEPAVNEPAPQIKLWFGSRLYQERFDKDGKRIPFVVSERTNVKAQIDIADGFMISNDIGAYSIIIDQGSATQKTLDLKAENIAKKVYAAGTAPADEKISALSLEYNLAEPLTSGEHLFAVSARSSGTVGTAAVGTYAATVEVMGGPVRLIGTPVTFPSPYSISKHGRVTIQYELSRDADIQLVFAGISAALVKNFTFNKGQEGGTAGINKVTWDGRTDRGTLAGNGIYLGTINSREDGRRLGTVKLTVVD